ncbi:hypothetical protein LJ707_13220 [Mucilaginibacter sp. UR6-1]|uniref:hypothetical protein n=1 Tax=Mucilaginibacter sp. UR6-1 TaxID=1435643 RepID=UPI001E29D5C9|nr:hypothetical protein [Mucilaginibacter sp. UR6-1]MCC8409892.1 hypothetical protein [Mucilaginibacter sp. UR6-1]
MEKEVEVIKVYDWYFVADRAADVYLMIDLKNDKCRLICADSYGIMELMRDLREDI